MGLDTLKLVCPELRKEKTPQGLAWRRRDPVERAGGEGTWLLPCWGARGKQMAARQPLTLLVGSGAD